MAADAEQVPHQQIVFAPWRGSEMFEKDNGNIKLNDHKSLFVKVYATASILHNALLSSGAKPLQYPKPNPVRIVVKQEDRRIETTCPLIIKTTKTNEFTYVKTIVTTPDDTTVTPEHFFSFIDNDNTFVIHELERPYYEIEGTKKFDPTQGVLYTESKYNGPWIKFDFADIDIRKPIAVHLEQMVRYNDPERIGWEIVRCQFDSNWKPNSEPRKLARLLNQEKPGGILDGIHCTLGKPLAQVQDDRINFKVSETYPYILLDYGKKAVKYDSKNNEGYLFTDEESIQYTIPLSGIKRIESVQPKGPYSELLQQAQKAASLKIKPGIVKRDTVIRERPKRRALPQRTPLPTMTKAQIWAINRTIQNPPTGARTNIDLARNLKNDPLFIGDVNISIMRLQKAIHQVRTKNSSKRRRLEAATDAAAAPLFAPSAAAATASARAETDDFLAQFGPPAAAAAAALPFATAAPFPTLEEEDVDVDVVGYSDDDAPSAPRPPFPLGSSQSTTIDPGNQALVARLEKLSLRF